MSTLEVDAILKVVQPSPVSPVDNVTLDTGPSAETPELDGGPAYSLSDAEHTSSQFQVSTSDTDFDNNIVHDSGSIPATTKHTVPAGNLVENNTYYWRVRYTDANSVTSEYSIPEEFSTASFLDYADPANIGTSTNGGFLVGVIDTVAGTIDSQDDYQTGERYALIVAPKSLETGLGPKWDSQGRAGEAGSFTRWDGLSSTDSILAKNDTSYEAFDHIRSIRSSDPVPADGGSDWYLPAMDELELIYRNLKPVAANNVTGNDTRTFPGSQDYGFNPSSDPTGSAYTSSGEPFQTSVTDFQDGGAEAVDNDRYWSSTDADEGGRAWAQDFARSGFEGRESSGDKDNTGQSVRPVRHISL
jgi:hypothetical protein